MLAANHSGLELEAGTDEAGRGCLAGPVVAAAVILPKDFYHPDLNDSKQISHTKRNLLRPIIEQEALAWSVQFIDAPEIDQINILNASILAMHKSIESLKTRPEFILVDGNRFKPFQDIPHETIIKGDGKYASIAAASVLAKTHRDEFMETIHQEFPAFNWQQNKGYPTEEHRRMLMKMGPTPYHRKSFQLKPVQTQLEF